LAELGILEQSDLWGTDSRASAVADARASIKQFWTTLPDAFSPLRERVGESQFVEQARRINWRVENIFSREDRSVFDVVFCRNVAIYLQSAATGRLWEILANSLAPEGILVTGKAEKPFPGRRWRRLDSCIYQAVPR
jgi:chemotaxis methyl-accepting protein methylase